MTQDFFKAETTKRYGIPLTHLDYTYIRDCSDVKELEKILKILRSGDEGHYPELENEAEKRLEQINPKSRILRKDNPVLRASDLDREEQEDLKNELETWRSDMEDKGQIFGTNALSKKPGADDLAFGDDANLPPVRSGKVISVDGKVKDTGKSDETEKKEKKVMPRSYKEWDKFDIDGELEKVDEEDKPAKKDIQPSTFVPERIAEKIDTQGMTYAEIRAKAVREKDKGNEAFHAHDYEESILYYTRSISIAQLTATHNNRALAYLRQSKWDKAISDCNYVLQEEPKNIKALLRRGTALKGKGDFPKACQDLNMVLTMESNNKTAQDLLKEISKLEEKAAKEIQERKEKGRRMVIEEVDGSDEDDDDEDVTEEIIVEKPDSEKKPAPLVNGLVETTSATSPLASAAVTEEKTSCTTEPSKQASHQAGVVPDTKSSKDTTSAKDIWSSKEAESEQAQDSKANSPKPKLVTTNILSDQEIPQSSTSDEKTREEEKMCSKESGNVTKTEELEVGDSGDAVCNDARQSGKETAVPSKGSDSAKSPEPTAQDQFADEDAAQTEVKHSRPVLVQKSFPRSEGALREQGNKFFREGQYPEAIDVYQKIIKRLEKDSEQTVNLSLIYSNRAACFLKTGNCQAAIDDCAKSLELVPHSVKPLLRRAQAFETMEKFKQAYVDYKHVLSVDWGVEQAHLGATRCQQHLQAFLGKSWRDQLPPLVRVSQWDVPQIVDESSSGEKVSTVQPLKQTIDKPSSSKEQQPKVSDIQQQKPASMENTSQEKVPSAEEQFESTKAQGNKHVQKGEYEAAVQCYCQCVKLSTNRAAVFTNRALCYLKLNRPKEAEDDCTTALALEQNNTKAYYRRALARKAQKHYKDSLQDLLQLLRLEPTNSVAKKELDIVKGLYKEEYDQIKAQPAPEKKPPAEAEKKRKRIKIEEVDEDSDTEEKESQAQQASTSLPKTSGANPKVLSPSSTSSTKPGFAQKPPTSHLQTQSSSPSDKHASNRTPESRKPGRGKSKKAGVKETSMGLPVTPVASPKLQGRVTPFEFIQHWNSLKQAKEIQPYVQLLEQISPEDLPGVISNKLDGHMLQIIARCAAHDAQTGEVERAYSILHNIRQVPRFSTVVMFLSNKEKQDIRKVLESTTSLGTHSAEEVAAVRKDYGLK